MAVLTCLVSEKLLFFLIFTSSRDEGGPSFIDIEEVSTLRFREEPINPAFLEKKDENPPYP